MSGPSENRASMPSEKLRQAIRDDAKVMELGDWLLSLIGQADLPALRAAVEKDDTFAIFAALKIDPAEGQRLGATLHAAAAEMAKNFPELREASFFFEGEAE